MAVGNVGANADSGAEAVRIAQDQARAAAEARRANELKAAQDMRLLAMMDADSATDQAEKAGANRELNQVEVPNQLPQNFQTVNFK